MQTGAVIVAAGMSSRMGDFKPMLNIGSISIAQRVVATFQQAGVEKIVMVTGYKATDLERHLANHGVVFLRNEDYAHTQMFDSAKIGLQYLQDKCDQVLFTPVDIPLFTAATIHALLDSGADLACPVCGGESGHPILIASHLIDSVLNDDGEGGLRGALDRCGTAMAEIPVSDQGVLHDADTPQDYAKLLRFHNKQLVRPVVNLCLAREKPFFDQKAAMLLELVDETQSVRNACAHMQMSYTSGWNLIKTMESQLNIILIERSQGGAGGSKSSLTPQGKQLLEAYEDYCTAVKTCAGELFDQYFSEIL